MEVCAAFPETANHGPVAQARRTLAAPGGDRGQACMISAMWSLLELMVAGVIVVGAVGAAAGALAGRVLVGFTAAVLDDVEAARRR